MIVLGDCEVYENFDPISIWKNYGITMYIRGNADQKLWQSYYLLEDTLITETPKVVVLNVQQLMFDKPEKEEYNRMVFDGMRWSCAKMSGILASMMPDENIIDYIFPILRYHSRITQLSQTDFEYYFNRRHITHNGYYMRIDVLPVSESDVASDDWVKKQYGYAAGHHKKTADSEGDEVQDIEDPWGEYSDDEDEVEDPWEEHSEYDGETGESRDDDIFGKYAIEYLDKICSLCKENGIRLVLVKAPSLSPVWTAEQEGWVEEYTKDAGLEYINFYELLNETGIDYETDTYDGGLHMNYSGALKLSGYLGEYLYDECGLEDHRGDEALSSAYDEKIHFQEDMIKAQNNEIIEYGEIVSY